MDLEVLGDQIEASTRIQKAHLNSIETIAARPDGIEVATGSHDHTVKLWDVEEAKSTRTLEGHKQGVWTLDYSPDGRLLLSGSADGTLMLWDSNTNKCVRTLSGHVNKVYWGKFNEAGNQIISCGQNSSTMIWGVSNGSVIKKFNQNELTYCAQWSKNNQHIVTTNYSGQVKVFDAKTYNLVAAATVENVEYHRVYACDTDCSGPNTRIFVGCQDKTIRDYTLQGDKLKLNHTLENYHFDEVKSLSNYPKKKLVLSTGRDGSVRLWNLGQHGLSIKCNLVGHEDNVSKAVVVPNVSTIVASGGWDQVLNIWRLKI